MMMSNLVWVCSMGKTPSARMRRVPHGEYAVVTRSQYNVMSRQGSRHRRLRSEKASMSAITNTYCNAGLPWYAAFSFYCDLVSLLLLWFSIALLQVKGFYIQLYRHDQLNWYSHNPHCHCHPPRHPQLVTRPVRVLSRTMSYHDHGYKTARSAT